MNVPKTSTPHRIPVRLLSVAEFAQAIKCGLRTAYDMTEDGRVRTVAIGANRIGIPPEEVPRFLKNAGRRAASVAKENAVTA
jgi:excisionase family DNA binding protein